MTVNNFSEEIFKKYGPITRARNYFLYTKKGVRLTDLFQENGRAILGWNGGNAFTHLKNTLSKGLTGSFLCEESSRVQKAVNKLLCSDRNIYYFSNIVDIMKNGLTISPTETNVYLPWVEATQKIITSDCVIIEPPLPWTQTIYILAVKKDLSIPDLQSTIKIPFALETAIAKSLYNLIKELNVRQEKDWFLYDNVLKKYFARKGPYLFSRVPEDLYDDFVIHCLNLGILINPDCNRPSLIPYGVDKGVFTKLKNNPFNF